MIDRVAMVYGTGNVEQRHKANKKWKSTFLQNKWEINQDDKKGDESSKQSNNNKW